ncbi:MAG: VgrG-related protein [Anaerolineales bacterium]|nr:VgrG-related protein [Anaerolineales bacterium]
MTEKSVHATKILLSINGQKLEEAVMGQVAEVIVEQHVHLPHMFTIRLYDPQHKLLDGPTFELTKKVKIAAGDAEQRETTLMEGEITAVEPIFGEGMIAELVVRGYDLSHRLYRETKSRAFLNVKDSDLAEQIAAEIEGVTAVVDPTSTVYEHVYQHNQSDLAFLMQRAWRIGYECFIEEQKLYFRKPTNKNASVTLTWGADLLAFYPRMTLAEQVDEVIVKGWDADQQKPIVGKSQTGELYPKLEKDADGAALAGKFGAGKLVIVDQPVLNQSEADALAKARLNERSGAFVQAHGLAYRHPEIRAGEYVKLELLGERFSGAYLVTATRHIYNPDGFRTKFVVMGARTGQLADTIQPQPPLTRWPGVVTAVVTNTDDPQNWGRVKVKFPWMADDAESDWARLIGPGGGPEAGLLAVPDVNDEVLVTFEQGDFSRPFVLGGLWNGQHAVPPPNTQAGQNERPLIRTWHSRSGHAITMYDDASNKVELVTAGGHTITVDDASSKIAVKSSGGLTITLDDNGSKITVESGGDIDVKATGNLNLKGMAVNIN